MSSALRQTRSTAARAIAAFLAAQIEAARSAEQLPAAWMSVTIQLLEGVATSEEGELKLPEQFDSLQFPAVIIGCTRAHPHDMGNGYYVCEVTVMTVTQLDETEAPRRHDDRVGFISACFLNQVDDADPDRESLDIVAAALNAPGSGEDSRAVKNFHCFGIAGIDEEGSEAQRRVIDSLKLELHCQATDATE